MAPTFSERPPWEKIQLPPLTAESWKAGALSLLAVLTEEGQQRALASWAKISAKGGGPFRPTVPVPAPAGVAGATGDAVSAEAGELLADFTVLDLEFTPPADLLELAAVRYVNWLEVGRYVSLVRYRAPIHPMVSTLTGITERAVYNAPEAKQVLQGFRELAGGSVLVCHNISADRRVLEATRTALGAATPLANPWLCTLALAKLRQPKGSKCGLGELCTTLGIATHGAHRALRDVEMCYQVLRHFHRQQPVTELITSTAKPKAAGTGQLFATAR